VRPGAGGTATTAARCGLARLGAGGGQGGRSRGRLVSRGGRDSTERPAQGAWPRAMAASDATSSGCGGEGGEKEKGRGK
jgi:hypothetical protein